MNGVLGHDSALKGYIGPRKTWANEIYFGMNDIPELIAQAFDLQSQHPTSMLRLPPDILVLSELYHCSTSDIKHSAPSTEIPILTDSDR